MGAFAKLASSVVKHYKKYIVLWLAILLLSLPFVSKMGEVLVYEEMEAGGEEMVAESITAGKIVAKEFPSSGDNNSLIVVLQATDVRSPAVRQYVLSVEDRLWNDDKVENLKNVTSIYSVYRSVIERSAGEIGPVLYSTEANMTSVSYMLAFVTNWGGINGTLMMVWGLPSGYAQAWDGINGSSMMLYGLPSMYSQAYDGYSGAAMMLYGLPSMYSQAWDGVNGSAMMLYGLPSMYSQAWDGVNGSALMLYGLPDMYQQAWDGTNMTAFMLYGIPYMYGQNFDGANQTAALLYGGPAAYLQAWLALSMIPDMKARNLEAFNQSWSGLNATITDEVQRQMMLGYHSVFYGYWDETFNASNTSVYLDPLAVVPDERANNATRATAPSFFDFSVPVNQTQQMMDGIMDVLNVSTFSNITLVNTYTNTSTWQYLDNLMSGMGISAGQRQMLAGYYDAFAAGWAGSLQNVSLQGLGAKARASLVVGQVAPGYIAQLAAGNETMNQSMMGVLGAFNITSWMNESLLSSYTNSTFSQMLQQMSGGFGLPPEMVQQLYMYYDAFYTNWNASFQNSSQAGITPAARAAHAVNATAPPFIAQTSAANATAGAMLQGVYQAFNLSSYGNLSLVTKVANDTFYTSMQAMAGSFGMPPEQLQGLWMYYDLFYRGFQATLQNSSLAGATTMARTQAAVDAAAPVFINASAGTNETMKAMLDGVYSTFNLTSWSNLPLITSFANSTFYTSLQAEAGSFGMPPEQLQGLFAYYGMFYDSFKASFQNASLAGASTAGRTKWAIDSAAPAFIAATTANNSVEQMTLTKIYYTFNLTSWSNSSALSLVTFSNLHEELRKMSAGLGLSPDMSASLMRYFTVFEGGWNATLGNASLAGSSTLERTKAAIDIAAPQYINETTATNATVGAMLQGVYGAFNITNWNNTTLITAFANTTFYTGLQGMVGSLGLPPEMTLGLFVYYDMFYKEWQASYSNASFTPATSLARASYAIDRTAPAFAAGGRPEAPFAGAAYRNFNLTTYGDAQNATKYVTGAALLETRAQMNAYLATGNYTAGYTATVRGNLEMFAGLWNRTFMTGDTLYLPLSTSLDKRVAAAFENATKAMFPSDGGGSGSSGGMSSFNMTKLADPAQARNLTLDLFLANLGGAIKFDRAFVEMLLRELGPSPTKAQVAAFAAGVINSTDFDSYPVQLPSELTKNFVNEKHTTMIFMLGFSSKKGGNSEMMKKNIAESRSVLGAGRSSAGARTYVTGDIAISGGMEDSAFKDVEKIDPFTVGIVLVLVSLFFLSLVAPFTPFIGIGVAVVASQVVLWLIGTFVAKIHYSVNILLFTLLMGTGMDYCIFILARYREERREGHPKEEAVRTSITWAGESIATSGVAVMIGFSGLVVSDFAMLKTMGYVLSLAIGIGILAALTFLPAVLMVIGDRVFWPSKIRPKTDPSKSAVKDERTRKLRPDGKGQLSSLSKGMVAHAFDMKAKKAKKDQGVFYFTRAVKFSMKHPVAVVVLCLLAFFPSLYLMFVMQPSFDFFEGMPKTEAVVGFEVLGESFGKGDLMPSQVVVQFSSPLVLSNGRYDQRQLDSVDLLCYHLENMTIKDSEGNTMRIVRSASPSSYYLGERLDRIDWRVLGESSKNSTLNGAFGKSLRTVLVKIVFNKEPFQKESLDAVPAMRDVIRDYKKTDPVLSGAKVLVGGASAGMYDIRQIIDNGMGMMRIVVVIGIFILLLVVLGSVLIPATAILSVGISIAWTIAATMVIFQFNRGIHVLWMVPLILFIMLMGLGMDYNIFLITRVREEVSKGRTHEEAIVRSVERTGGIITICGMIMGGAFGSMMLSGLGLLQQFGFALFFSIMLDAFVVRIYLMPAILKLSGKYSWWAPGRLQRVRIGKDGRGLEVGRVPKKERPLKYEEE